MNIGAPESQTASGSDTRSAAGIKSEATRAAAASRPTTATDTYLSPPLNDEDLKRVLTSKLLLLSEEERTQQTIIVIWLAEILLHEMSVLRCENRKYTDQYTALQDQFAYLLEQDKVKKCMDAAKKAILQLLDEYGDEENFVMFTTKLGDVERLLDQSILNGKFIPALKRLEKESDPNLLYRYAPYLMAELPMETMSLIANRSSRRRLSPSRLIPALIQRGRSVKEITQDQQILEIIRFLESDPFTISGTDEHSSTLRAYLLTLCSQVQPEKFRGHIERITKDAEMDQFPSSLLDRKTNMTDLQNALDICLESGMKAKAERRAAVELYTAMGLFEEAFDVALSSLDDLQLAKRVANVSSEQAGPDGGVTDVPRKLWLRLAQRVLLGDRKSVRHGTEFLRECSLLKIQDLLQFFPHLTTMEHFGEAICAALTNYNAEIVALKEDMKEAHESSREIREEMALHRSGYHVIEPAESKCTTCQFPLMKRNFYIFSCGHHYHQNCLLAEVLPHVSLDTQTRIQEMMDTLKTGRPAASPAASMGDKEHERLQDELDGLIASECVLCGSIIIDSIDRPFTTTRN